MAQLEREPQRWRAELLMAIVGRITSFAIGFGSLALCTLRGLVRREDILMWLALHDRKSLAH